MPTKTQRLEMRLSADQKALLERAAALSGQVLASFIRSQAVHRAQEILEKHAQSQLSRRDFDQFLQILDQDKPSPALRKAFRRHKGRRG